MTRLTRYPPVGITVAHKARHQPQQATDRGAAAERQHRPGRRQRQPNRTVGTDGTEPATAADNPITHSPGFWYCSGTVTDTGTSRSRATQTEPVDVSFGYQQTPSSRISWASCSGEAAAAPQETTIGGSPYAAFCSE